MNALTGRFEPAVPAAIAELEAAVEPDFDFLSVEYRDLFARSGASAFQSPLWMRSVHRDLAGPLGAEKRTLTLRAKGDGRLLGLIPLVLQRRHGVALLGPADFGVCDYNAAVAPRAVLEAAAADPALLARLDAALAPASLLIFRKLRADAFDVARLFPSARRTPCDNAAYHSALGDDFEEWRRRTLRKKFSKELNRLARQLERDVGPYEHRQVEDEGEIRRAFYFARGARAGRFADDLFADETYFRFYLDFAIAGAPHGEAVTFVSYLKGEPVAMLFGPAGDGVFHAVVIAADMDAFGKYAPGTQILYQMIRQRFEAGHRLFDMGLGNTGYKSHFRVEETPLHNFTVSRSLAGGLVSMIYNHAKPVKNLLRRAAPQVR